MFLIGKKYKLHTFERKNVSESIQFGFQNNFSVWVLTLAFIRHIIWSSIIYRKTSISDAWYCNKVHKTIRLNLTIALESVRLYSSKVMFIKDLIFKWKILCVYFFTISFDIAKLIIISSLLISLHVMKFSKTPCEMLSKKFVSESKKTSEKCSYVSLLIDEIVISGR